MSSGCDSQYWAAGCDELQLKAIMMDNICSMKQILGWFYSLWFNVPFNTETKSSATVTENKMIKVFVIIVSILQ